MTDTDKQELTEQQWRFAGRRMLSTGKIGFAWEKPNGDIGRWEMDKGSNLVIGAVYTIRATPDETEAILRNPRYQETVNDEKRSEWVAKDREAQVANQLEAAVRAAKKTETESLKNMTLSEANIFINEGPWNTQAARLAIILKYLGAAS